MHKILNYTGKMLSIITFLALIIVELQVTNEDLLGNWSLSNLGITISTQEALAFGGGPTPGDGDLTCADLTNCNGTAGCNGAGTVNVCHLNCETGDTVICSGGGGNTE